MRAKVISICCQKGGVGKTTTAHALHGALTHLGYKCLSVDVNAQRNLSQCFNADDTDIGVTEVLLNPACIREAITETEQGGILVGGKDLATIDILMEKANTDGKFTRLKDALSIIGKDYDYIIVDTPPFMGTLLLNCLLASDFYIVAAESDAFSLTGAEDIIENVQSVKEHNKGLKCAGILITRFTGRAVLSRQLLEIFDKPAKRAKTTVFSTPIREGISIKECHVMRQSLYKYAPKSKPAADYMQFTEELLARINK